MYNDLIRSLFELQKDPDTVPRPANLGGNDDDDLYRVEVPGEPNSVYVRYTDDSTQDEVKNGGVPPVPGFPVVVYYIGGQAVAVMDIVRSIDFLSDNEGMSSVGPHSHEPGFGLFDVVSTRRMKEGIVTCSFPVSMSVDVEPFKFVNPSTNDTRWHDSDSIDLTDYIPTTADTHRWVMVAFDPVNEILVAIPDDEYALPILLTEEHLAAMSVEGYMTLAGVELRYGDTEINDDHRIRDWRFFLNVIQTGDVGSGGGSVDELADLDDVLSAAQTANFILAAGNGIAGGEYRGRLLVPNDIPSLDAAKITSGVFDVTQIPNLDASKITSGTFDVARIPNLPTSIITSGVFDIARIPYHAVSILSDVQSFSAASPILFTDEILDTDSFADLGGANDRFTIPSAALAGWYRINVTGTLLDLDVFTPTGWATLELTHNDSITNPQFFYSIPFDFASVSGTYAPGFSFELILNMVDDDYITLDIEPNVSLGGNPIYAYVYLTAQKIGNP